MKSVTYIIKDEAGLHARPVGLLAKQAKLYKSKLMIIAKGKEVELTKLMAVMSLGIKKDETLTITAEGPDEEIAISELESFLNKNV